MVGAIQINLSLLVWAAAISEKLLRRIVNRFRGGLVFKADRLLYHSTLGLE